MAWQAFPIIGTISKKCLKVRQALGTWKLWKLEKESPSDSIDLFAYNQWVSMLDMKTKVVKNVPRKHLIPLTHMTHVNIQTFRRYLNSWFPALKDFQSFSLSMLNYLILFPPVFSFLNYF